MNVKNMLAPVTRVVYKVYGKTAKHAPEILLAGGLVSMVAGAIVACERTTKAEEIIDQAKESIDTIHKVEKDELVEYTQQDKRRDLTLVYTKTGLKFAKLYLPAVALEALGIACILSSYGIMKSRNAALTAAYTALEHSYSEYRRRVREKLGEEEDLYFRTGMETKAVELTEKDENGLEKVTKTEEKVFNPDPESVGPYAVWFDERSINYRNDANMNKSFILGVWKTAQTMLDIKGYLFLNDVYDMLGIPRCPKGQAVGWMKGGKAGGDGHVDFGIFDGYRQSARDFVNGYEKAILLDFNVDPQPIWDKI